MTFGRKDHMPHMDIAVYSGKLEQVRNYCYLRHTLIEDRRCEVKIKKIIEMAKPFSNMKTVLFFRNLL